MSVSVHAISCIYDLRALRSRLQSTMDSGLLDYYAGRDVEWSIAMINMLLLKIERTGEYIANLERAYDLQAGLQAEAAQDLGPDVQPGDHPTQQ